MTKDRNYSEDKMAENLRQRLRSTLKPLDTIDKEITAQLSLCADKTSLYGNWRPSMKILEISCHGLTWLAGCLVVLWLTQNAFVQEIVVNLLSAGTLDIAIIALLKAIVRRKRPPGNDDMFVTIGIDNYSFPSGHSSRATLLALIFYHKNIGGIFVVFMMTVWACAVCISRILLGRHHVGDVLVGIVLGFIEAGLVLNFFWFGAESTRFILQIFVLFETFHTADSE